jgi:hypothetical protein
MDYVLADNREPHKSRALLALETQHVPTRRTGLRSRRQHRGSARYLRDALRRSIGGPVTATDTDA